jgi:hypothetical protein
MTVDADVLSEVYSILKQYIPSKDRQEAADNLMSIIVDLVDDQVLKEFAASDTKLSKAYKEYAGEDELDFNDDE